ncbi:Por secretion system C-terminal sorting domain-containing protein, partial [Porphyromonas crevioricanis]
TLTLTAVANEGYELDKVMAGETSVAMTAGADRTYTGTYQANASVTFVVTFKKTEQPQEKVTVTYAAPQNGQFSVKNGSDAVVTGSTVDKGSTLSLTAVADEGYELDKVMAGETSVAMTVGADRTYTGTYQANDNVIFTVSFKPIQKMYTVTVKATENGTIVLKNSEGQEVVSGSKVEEGSMITVVATPNEGFELKELKANDTDIFVAKTFKVEKDTEVTALFSQKVIKYTVVVAPTENGSVSLKDMQGNPVASASQVVAGTELEVVVTPSKGFKLESLLAGKENITETKKFVVNSNVTVVARFVLDDSVEAVASESVRVYPNPATDYVLVEANADAQIRLLSMNGRTLISARTSAEGFARIDLSSIAAGTYLLTIDGAVRKLIVK